MQPRLHIVTLGVPDLDAARRFYVDGLGWESALDVPGEVIFIQVGHGLLLGLFTGLAEDIGAPLTDGRHVPMSLAHNVATDDEVVAVLAQAEAAGGTIVKPAQRASVGFVHGYFADPFGFYWEVACNPGLTVDEAGNVTIA